MRVGGFKYLLRGLSQGLIYAGYNIAVAPFGTGVIITSFLRCWLANGTWVNGTDLVLPPGCVREPTNTTKIRIFEGKETPADVNLPTNASTAVLVEDFGVVFADPLYWSKKYTCLLGYRVTMWQNGTESNCGSMDAVVDLYITTDGAGVATVAFQSVPPVPASPALLPGATMTAAPSAGGFTIFATRPPGVDCDVEAAWWCHKLKDIT